MKPSNGGKTPRVVVFAALLSFAALSVFAIQLARNQDRATETLLDRFEDRAVTNAALTGALFGSTTQTTSVQLSEELGGKVTTADLDRRIETSGAEYLVLVDASGKALAASSGVTRKQLAGITREPEYIQLALGSQGFGVSNVIRSGSSGPEMEFATGFEAGDGRRALVQGLDPVLISVFLGSYLRETPREQGGAAYIVDERGTVIVSTRNDLRFGDNAADIGLPELGGGATAGKLGDERFAVARIEGLPWTVIATAPESELLETVQGSNKWVPWGVFAAFALAALAALFLLRRALQAAAQLNSANEKLAGANAALEERAHDLQRSNEDLEQFASIASHDLSEPLRKVSMFAERLIETEGDALSERGRGYLDRMTAATERMTDLIQDLLEFSRVSTRGHGFESVDLGPLIEEISGDLEAPITEAGARVEVGELPPVHADRAQMRQLFQNLISNGVKFRREGVEPVVRISGEARGGMVQITVADNGIGFEPQYAQRIFRVFERLHGGGAFPGTGIGLALCRKIAERHGGGIIARSDGETGAEFVIDLPAANAGGTTPAEAVLGNE